MAPRLHIASPKLLRLMLVLALVTLFVPPAELSTAATVEVILEDPDLHPDYVTCKDSYWSPFNNDRGHTAYLTLNASNPANSTNSAEWRPTIPQAGYYRVSAYIAAHGPTTWCTGDIGTVAHDTTQARYSIHHAVGESTRTLSQYPLGNQWLDLGEFYFTAGSSGYVTLSDLNDEADFSTSISFSAMRFSYTRAVRPQIYLPIIGRDDPVSNPSGNVGVVQGQGFDTCSLPTVSKMHTWWHQSPYEFYALYLGGIQLGSTCTRATASWVSQVHQQGWSFVPTWVGPQAPCTNYTHRMSSDPALSYQQGRQEAQAASDAAAALGLSSSATGGTIIYYDMEAYGYSSAACRVPVSAFMNGWVQRLHEMGNLAGGYGTRNSFITDWATIPSPPDDIWPASWYASSYDPYASVYGIAWLQGLWTNHQRIRQYAGDHSEHWGGVGLGIDSNVADGVVALPRPGVLSTPTSFNSPIIDDAGWLSPERGWLVANSRLFWTTDGGASWQDISPAAVQMAYFEPSGQAWSLTTPEEGGILIFHTADGGITWESLPLDVPQGEWRAVQLQFTSASSGWMVLKKVTSQAFDIGILLMTTDGGLSWETSTLPTAARIDFLTASEGWLVPDFNGQAYYTTDGGLTWQPDSLVSKAFSAPDLPVGSSLWGWQADGLGWAVISEGTCSGEKSTSSFSCLLRETLWQTQDGGQVWEPVSLPAGDTPVQ